MPLVKPKVRDGLTVVELDGEAVIYDEETTELHHLNPTATIVFGLCDGRSRRCARWPSTSPRRSACRSRTWSRRSEP